MPPDPGAERAFKLLVADALEALLPLIDGWAETVETQVYGDHPRGYREGYEAGVRRLSAEVKDQLIERVLLLRE